MKRAAEICKLKKRSFYLIDKENGTNNKLQKNPNMVEHIFTTLRASNQ